MSGGLERETERQTAKVICFLLSPTYTFLVSCKQSAYVIGCYNEGKLSAIICSQALYTFITFVFL